MHRRGLVAYPWLMCGIRAFASGVFNVGLALALLVGPALAQTPAPTAEQLEIFRNLTPEQQEALLEELPNLRTDSPAQQRDATRPSTGQQTGDSVDRRGERRTTPEKEDGSPKKELERIPVLQPRDTVLVEVALAEERKGEPLEAVEMEERERLSRLVELILSRNPYQLDRDAQLNLPGFAPIAFGGLTEQQATQRLSLEPVLLPLKRIRVVRLPLAKTGVEGLKPFGYDLFDNAPTTFSPLTDVPVPADYVIGPGDEIHVQLYGSQNRNQRLTVSRDGSISFPELGPVYIGGMTFNAAREAIEARVSQEMIGVEANISMGNTRTIRVMVTGEARFPGYYTVSGLATMTTALFASGGIREIGSLRDIQLKRQGQVVRRLDLYDLLIRGDNSDDAKLLPGDAIFIPPVGPTVSVDGEVKRPAVYELREEATVDDVIRMAGGLTSEADPRRASLTRIDQGARRVVVDVNLREPAGAQHAVGNGDVLRIARLRPQIDSGVQVEGFVHRPGPVAWREGLRISDVIASVDELKPSADQQYVLIRRENAGDRRVSVLSANLAAALASPGSAADVVLMPRDRVIVFELAPGRERIIQPLLEELRLQSEVTRPTEVVRVGGRVKVPGEYPLEPGMRIGDLIRAGAGLDPGAYLGEAELIRYVVDDSGSRMTELITIDVAALSRGDVAANLVLQPYDYLVIKETPSWRSQESVTLRGEVRFPGTYPIRRGETLLQVLERAGGLTPLAFPEGSAFTRRDLQVTEQQQLDRLAERMRSDLAALSLQAANVGRADTTQALVAGQAMLAQLSTAKATGRYVIDLPGLLSSGVGGPKDVLLRDGDTLLIPKVRQEVTVIGEVQSPTSLQYLPDLSRSDYIAMSGGTTAKADKRRIHIVRADGRVASSRSRLTRKGGVEIKPGDTIVVPLDTQKMPRLPFWQAVTQILYNLAVSVAAVNSF